MKRIIATKVPRSYIKSSSSKGGPSKLELKEAAKIVSDHINNRLSEYDYPRVNFRTSKFTRNYLDEDEANYSTDLIDPNGVKTSIVLEFQKDDDGEWFERSTMWDLTDELDEFFYDYCSNAGIEDELYR